MIKIELLSVNDKDWTQLLQEQVVKILW